MRNLIFTLTAVFLLVGCSSPADTGENLTIFGRLSQLVQLGSTEETIEHRLPAGDFLITVDGEILEEHPALLKFIIADIETGIVRDDLTLTLQLCNAIDPELAEAKCDDEETALYVRDIAVNAADGAYISETFMWDRSGDWDSVLTIEEEGAAEPIIATFETDVYPKRPPSSNAFELTNISLPFIVIGLFLLATRLMKWQLLRSAEPTIETSE